MDFMSAAIHFVGWTLNVVDSLLGPYVTLYQLSHIDNSISFVDYFNYDLPVSVKDYAMIKKYQIWVKAANEYLMVNEKEQFKPLILSLRHIIFTDFSHAHYLMPVSHGNVNYLLDNENYTFSAPSTIIYPCEQAIDFTTQLISSIKSLLVRLNQPVYFDLTPVFMLFEKPALNYLSFCKRNIVTIWNFFINSFYMVFFSFYFFSFFVSLTRKLLYTNFLVRKVYSEHDQEATTLEDFLVYIVFFAAFVINSLDANSTSELVETNITLSMWFMYAYFTTIVWLLPASILFVTGSNCFIYVKGTDKYNSFFAYLVFDIIAVLAFFLRFFLQLIRWCLFLTTYYLLHEFVFEWMYSLFVNFTNSFNPTQSLIYWINSNAITQTLLHFVRFTFEFFDTCLILVIQITAFIAVVMWLFNYLFSVSVEDIYESQPMRNN